MILSHNIVKIYQSDIVSDDSNVSNKSLSLKLDMITIKVTIVLKFQNR